MKPTARLRQMLKEPGIIAAPGAYDALSARIIEREGFPIVYVGGGATTGGMLGKTDVGLITMTELVTSARNIAFAVKVPVICDADTGFGNPINVIRTVQEFERAGVAAIHIEDQVWPKRCGHFEGKHVIPTAEMVQKIRAACDARQDPDFVIIARCDAIAVTGFEDAIRRGRAYAEAGAEVLFMEAPRTLEQVQAIARSFPDVPLLFHMAETGKTPFLSVKQLEEMGYKIVIHPASPRLAACKGMIEVLRELKRTGLTEGVRDKMISFTEWTEITGLPQVRELEARYGTAEDSLPGYMPEG